MKTLLETAVEIGPVINQYIDEEENNRRLSKPVLKALRDAGFCRLFMPKSLGGLEIDPLTVVAQLDLGASWV